MMNINMYESDNKADHHTDAYKLSNLIIRRGQEFIMGIVFNRPFNPAMDLFLIEFLIGEPLLSVHIKCKTVYRLIGFTGLYFVSFSNEKEVFEKVFELQFIIRSTKN